MCEDIGIDVDRRVHSSKVMGRSLALGQQVKVLVELVDINSKMIGLQL